MLLYMKCKWKVWGNIQYFYNIF